MNFLRNININKIKNMYETINQKTYVTHYNNIFKQMEKPLGRWAIDKCEKSVYVTNYYSNIDHCGDCFYNKIEIDTIVETFKPNETKNNKKT